MNGRLILRAGVQNGRTVLRESVATFPLQVLRPHAAHCGGGLSLVVLLSGGLLDGDEASIDVVVEAGARLALRTQAATQVHAGRSRQILHATVGEHACLSYLPHAVANRQRALTDDGNALRLVDRFGTDLRFVEAWGAWLIWDDSRWQKDERRGVFELAKETARLLHGEAEQESNAEYRARLAHWGARSESNTIPPFGFSARAGLACRRAV